MIHPALMRMLQSQPGVPVDKEMLRRNMEALQNNAGQWQMPPPVAPTAQNPMVNPLQHVSPTMADAMVGFRDSQAPQFTPQEMAPAPQAPPQQMPQQGYPGVKPQGYMDRLLNDPQRMGLLRYGLGVLGGERMGTAMDKGMATAGYDPRRYETVQDPYGFGGAGQIDPVTGKIVGYQSKPGANRITNERQNWEYMMSLPEGPGKEAFKAYLMRRGSGGGTKAIMNFERKQSIKNDPNLTPEQKKTLLAEFERSEYAEKLYNAGDALVTPRGKAIVQKGLPPEKEPDYLGKAAEAGVGGKGKAKRLQTDIDVGVRSADATSVVRRNLDLLKLIKTGGWQAAEIKFRALFGQESANEGELIRNMGLHILKQIKPIFGAAPSVEEGRMLIRLEQGLGKSTPTNVRLLTQALKDLERLANIGMKGAANSGDYRTAQRIKEALAFDLSEGLEEEQAEPTTQDKLKEMTDEEFKRKYDSRRKR